MITSLPISMSKPTLILVVILVAIHQSAAQLPTAKPDFYAESCGVGLGNYTTNSTYEANILTVLTDLLAQSSVAYFSNASAGSSATDDQVFGQYYCRGDISSSICSECVKQAAATTYVNCHNFKVAVVWFRECTLRYQYVSFVGVEAELPNVIGWNKENATDPLTFGAAVNKTMTRLITETAVNSLLFAVGDAAVSALDTVYCLVQCSPDLNSLQCDTCLHTASGFIPSFWATAVSVFLPSCQLRYSTAIFYSLPNAPPSPTTTTVPSATVTSPPPPPMTTTVPPVTVTSTSAPPPPMITASPRPSGSTMLRCGKSLNIGLLILAVVLTVLRFN